MTLTINIPTLVLFLSFGTPSAEVRLVWDSIADTRTQSNLFCVAQCPGVNQVSGRLAGVCAQATRNNQARGTWLSDTFNGRSTVSSPPHKQKQLRVHLWTSRAGFEAS